MLNVKFNWKPSKYWLPARWWSPGCLHLRLGPAVFTLPRWLWSHRSDVKAKCACCGRVKTIEDYPQFVWCRDCILLARQLRGMLGPEAPSWWLDDLRRFLKREVWPPTPSGRRVEEAAEAEGVGVPDELREYVDYLIARSGGRSSEDPSS